MTETPFQQSWQRAWAELGGAADGVGLWRTVLAAYEQPGRAYHNRQHLAECLTWFERCHHLAQQPAELVLALWFHDAIYDVHADDSEARSARWAAESLGRHGLAAASLERIQSLILATCHDGAPMVGDAGLLLDVDLSILGAAPARFAQYQTQIRQEYAHVAEALFQAKRREILQNFLSRPRLYHTEFFHLRLEQQARENLRCALGL